MSEKSVVRRRKHLMPRIIVNTKHMQLFLLNSTRIHFITICLLCGLMINTYGIGLDSSVIKLRDKIKALVHDDPDSALWLIEKAMTIARRHKDSVSIAALYTDKGSIFRATDPDRAINYYYKTLRICKEINYKEGIAIAYSNLGTFAIMPFEKKLALQGKSISLLTELKDTLKLIMAYNNIANSYIKEGRKYDSPGAFLDSAYIFNGKAAHFAHEVNYIRGLAFVERHKGNVEALYCKDTLKALQHFYNALKLFPVDVPDVILGTKYNIMVAHFGMDQEDSAFYYYATMEDNLIGFPDIAAESYYLLSKYYAKNQDIQKAFYYHKKGDSVEEYFNSHNTENLFRLLEIEHEARLQEEMVASLNTRIRQANMIRSLMGGLFILTLLFSTILIIQQKQKSRKKREAILQKKERAEAERKLLASELKHSELKRQYLDDELRFTTKELTSFATNIVQSQSLWEDLQKRVSDISREKDPKRAQEQLKELSITLRQFSNNNEQRNEFLKRSTELNHSLVFYLKTHYPQLSETDTNLLVLILLKFTSKEISVLYNIEPASVKKKRNRLRKKMELPVEESFEDFFDRIMENLQLRGSA